MGKKNKLKQPHLQEVKKQEPDVETVIEKKKENNSSDKPQEPLVVAPQNKTIGEYLKEKREERKISLRTISQKTRISYTILSSLEEDQLNELPDQTYVKGFIKSVAKEIGLNENEAIQVLNFTYDSMNGNKTKPVHIIPVENTDEPMSQAMPQVNAIIPDKDPDHRSISHKVSKVFSPGAILGLVAGGFVLTILFIFMHLNKSQKQISRVQTKKANKIELKESITDINKNQAKPAVAATTPKEVILPTPMKAVSAEVDPNQKVVPVVAEAEKKPAETEAAPVVAETKPEEKKVEVPKPAEPEKKAEAPKPVVAPPVEKPAKEEVKKEVAKADENKEEKAEERVNINIRPFSLPLYSLDGSADEIHDEKILKPKFKGSIVKGKQNVLVTAHKEDTWLTYKTDSGDVKNFVLKKGRSVMIRGEDVRLFLGNAGAAKVFVNNELVVFKSPTGVKSLVFPHKNTSKYTLPLFIYDKKVGRMLTTQDYLDRYGR